MLRAFHRATDWIVDRPWVNAVVLLMLSTLAIVGYTAPQIVTDVFASRPAEQTTAAGNDRRSYEVPPDVNPVSLADADAIVVVESDGFFTPAGAAAIRRVVEKLESLDYVQTVLWMDRVPILNIFGLREPLFPQSGASTRLFAAARDKALRHPLVGGQLLSADGRTLLLLVKFDWLFVKSDEDCTVGLRTVAQTAASDAPAPPITFRVTGRVPMFVTAMQAHEENQFRYQLIGYSMIALMSVVLFRGLTAVIIVSLGPSLGVFWTLGMLRFFDLHENPFNDVVLPVLLSLIGLTDGVHLMVQIRRRRASGLSAVDAARSGIREVGLACALTSFTTAIGFGSLSLAHNQIVQDFGWSCVVGVLLTFLAVVLSIPLVCSSWLGRRVHMGHGKGLVDKHMNRVSQLVELVLANPKTVSIIGIVTTSILLLVCGTLRPDERRANALPTSSEAATALRHMDRSFGGLEFSYVDVWWLNNVPSDSPEILQAIIEVDDLLRQEELIGHPLSIRNFIDALPGEGSAADRMSLLELLPPPLKRAFYTPEYRRAQVSFRVQDLGIAKYGPVFERLETGLLRIGKQHPQFSFEMQGSAVRRWRNIYQIVVDLAASLGSASVIIFLVLAMVYRSIRIGLISIIPNLFPLAMTGSFLVMTGQGLELVSVCAFTVCLGIAVDDTIHFLTRFEEERATMQDDQEAIRRAFTGVGTALIMTTIVLIAGFSSVLLSDSRDQRIFATMGGLTIASALFGDLIFLPALLSRFAKKKTPS